MSADVVTRRWIRDASDELAVRNGCRFDEAAGVFVLEWMEEYLRLYEGVWAGEPFVCSDWQEEFVMRCFGWQRRNVSWRKELPDREWIRRFRSAFVMIAKKNKKSPTLAAVMLYMLAGDGVLGQKCFPGAKDGAQIRQNVMMHVVQMVEQSPELSAECVINKNLCSVFHAPTNSLLLPLSSSNSRTQKSKEGLNGSCFIDEVHVVDEAFIRRIDRAGISRPEPLHLEVTTAGDDQDSYGFSRYLYSKAVASGEVEDDTHLSMVYEAPQNLSDADLAADPVKYGKMANPAWGHTVKEDEYLADYHRSRSSLRKLADFKMYRLNIWQATATPWLDMAAWDRCDGAVDFDAGGPIYCGLDLSSKNDFTAFVCVQKQDDTFAVKGHYWVTEDRARKHSDAGLPVYDWAAQGWVTICDGSRIDYAEVEAHIEQFCGEHTVMTVGHDPWNAEGTRQRIESQGLTNLVEIQQTFKGLSDASKSLETLVSSCRLAHAGDPVLRWMAKNATVRHDNHDNIKPVKPPRETMKAVDGVVALVMAIGEAEANELSFLSAGEGGVFG